VKGDELSGKRKEAPKCREWRVKNLEDKSFFSL
jgi:hypothetical protein